MIMRFCVLLLCACQLAWAVPAPAAAPASGASTSGASASGASAASSARTAPAAPGAELVYASPRDIGDLNPHDYQGEAEAQAMVFEPLAANTQDGVKPWLAERWEISADGREYLFHLRRGVAFSDGEPFNAEAVKRNFDAVMADKSRHAWLELVDAIERWEAVDEHAFRLVLKRPYAQTLTELGMPRPFRFISPRGFLRDGARDGVQGHAGTGPWMLAEHEAGRHARFTANPGYWGEGPRLSAVRWLVLPRLEDRMAALRQGRAHLVFGDGCGQPAPDAKGRYAQAFSQPHATRALILNSRQPFTGEKAVRLALQSAIDREGLVRTVLGPASQAASTLMAPGLPGLGGLALERRAYDPGKAASLLDEAGWRPGADGWRVKDGRRACVRLCISVRDAQERAMAKCIQQDLAAIGVDAAILAEESVVFLRRMQTGEFEMHFVRSAGRPLDPQAFLASWLVPDLGIYHALQGLERRDWLEQAIARTMREPDAARRAVLHREILAFVHGEGLFVPLAATRIPALHAPSLKGVAFSPNAHEILFGDMHF